MPSNTLQPALPPSSQPSLEPLAVRLKTAWALLECGHTHGYKLIEAGELDSFVDGTARKITMASIKSYIARQLAKAGKVRNSPAKPFKDRKRARKKTAAA